MKRDEGSGSHGREEISIHNSLITNNKTKKLLGFGKSFENKPLSSNVYFKNCEISNNSFQRAFLNFDYRKERNAQFNSCNINSNKIFDRKPAGCLNIKAKNKKNRNITNMHI